MRRAYRRWLWHPLQPVDGVDGEPLPLWPDQTRQPGGANDEGLPRMMPFPAPVTALHGAIVVCPGGGYRTRAAHEGEPVARWLNSLGISAFVLEYRVAPHRHPLPLADVQRALRYVRHHAGRWQIDPRRVGVLGFSAGGHLAATAAVRFDAGDPGAPDPVERESSRPDAVVLCYPVITFGPHGHQGSMRNLLGDDPPPELRRQLSNERHVTPQTPPVFLWHTAADAGVPVENSLLFASALAGQGVPFELHVFPAGRHGLGLASDDGRVGAWTELCRAWLMGLGFPAR